MTLEEKLTNIKETAKTIGYGIAGFGITSILPYVLPSYSKINYPGLNRYKSFPSTELGVVLGAAGWLAQGYLICQEPILIIIPLVTNLVSGFYEQTNNYETQYPPYQYKPKEPPKDYSNIKARDIDSIVDKTPEKKPRQYNIHDEVILLRRFGNIPENTKVRIAAISERERGYFVTDESKSIYGYSEVFVPMDMIGPIDGNVKPAEEIIVINPPEKKERGELEKILGIQDSEDVTGFYKDE